MPGRIYEVVFRLPFLLMLEVLLTVDLRDFEKWITHARLVQIFGKKIHSVFSSKT